MLPLSGGQRQRYEVAGNVVLASARWLYPLLRLQDLCEKRPLAFGCSQGARVALKLCLRLSGVDRIAARKT